MNRVKYSISVIIISILLLNVSCEKNTTQSTITVSNKVTNNDFGGMGFHVFYHIFEAPDWHYNQVFAKRWRELNPAFARVTDIQDGAKGWVPVWSSREQIDKNLKYLEVMKDTDTELYFTTWGSTALLYRNSEEKKYITEQLINGKHFSDLYDSAKASEIEDAYIKKEVDNLEYIKNVKGFKNLNYYNMTNEMSMVAWGDMLDSTGFRYFKKIHSKFYKEFQKRNIGIKLLSNDASPISNWYSIEWAAENMDDISGVYGGHHYINNFHPLDNSFYTSFFQKMKWGAGIAKNKNKRFIIGEFGAKQNSNIIDSVYRDECIYNNTPIEPYLGVQIAEAMVAMINAGVYSAGYWTFNDFPSKYIQKNKTTNGWGISKWKDDDVTPRAHYFSVGLITKFLRGPAEVYEVNSSDSLLRVAAIKNLEDNSVSIAVVNRNETAQNVNLNIDELEGVEFRKYVYDPENVPYNYFGDLQDYSKKVNLNGDNFNDEVPAYSLVVYTSKFDEAAPEKVKNIEVIRENDEVGRVRFRLEWDENKDDDFCYYRIYRSEKEDFTISKLKQIASTIDNNYTDLYEYNEPKYYYKVVAVDNSGNVSE